MSLPPIIIFAMAAYSAYTAVKAAIAGDWTTAILAGIGAFAGFSAVAAATSGATATASTTASTGAKTASTIGATKDVVAPAITSDTVTAVGAGNPGIGAGGIPIDKLNVAAITTPPVDALLSSPAIMADTAGMSLIDKVSSAIGTGAENLVEWGTGLVKNLTTGDIFDSAANLVSSGTDTSGGGLLKTLGGAKGLGGAAIQGYGQHQQTKSLEKSKADSLAAQEKRRKMKSTFVATPSDWGKIKPEAGVMAS